MYDESSFDNTEWLPPEQMTYDEAIIFWAMDKKRNWPNFEFLTLDESFWLIIVSNYSSF